MLKTNEELTDLDLIRPLSLEVIQYFAGGDIPLSAEDKSACFTKFVRIGGAMVIGSTAYYGERDWQGDKEMIKHHRLLSFLKFESDIDFQNQAHVERHQETLLEDSLHDAGQGIISVSDSGSLTYMLTGQSFDFGRADVAGRQRTVEVAQLLVGNSVRVYAD